MDPLVGLALGAVVGAIAGFVLSYEQNAIGALVVLGIGATVFFGLAGVTARPFPGVLAQFMEVGGLGFVGAAAGAPVGWFLGDEQRKKKKP